jgi:hypothetical protein
MGGLYADGRTLFRPPAESHSGRYLAPEFCTLHRGTHNQLPTCCTTPPSTTQHLPSCGVEANLDPPRRESEGVGTIDRRSHLEERKAVRDRPGTRDDRMKDRAAEDRTLDEI